MKLEDMKLGELQFNRMTEVEAKEGKIPYLQFPFMLMKAEDVQEWALAKIKKFEREIENIKNNIDVYSRSTNLHFMEIWELNAQWEERKAKIQFIREELI